MRGKRNLQSTMLAFVNLVERVPPDHSLRIIKKVAAAVLSRMSDDFDNMYSRIGRASVPPEQLLGTGLRKVPFGRYGGNDSGSDMILTLMSLSTPDILTIILH